MRPLVGSHGQHPRVILARELDTRPDGGRGAVRTRHAHQLHWKLSKVFGYILRNEGCTFLVKNEDSTYPASDGLLPGVGSISVPLRYALGRDPIAIGKLQWTTLDCIRAKCILPPPRNENARMRRSMRGGQLQA